MESGMSKDLTYCILTDALTLGRRSWLTIKNCSESNIVRTLLKRPEKTNIFFCKIVTGDETGYFQYDSKTEKWSPKNESATRKSRIAKSKMKTMLTCFYDTKGIVHPPSTKVHTSFYLAILRRLLHRFRRIWLEYSEYRFLIKNCILLVNHSMRYADSLTIQNANINIRRAMLPNDLESSFQMLLSRGN